MNRKTPTILLTLALTLCLGVFPRLGGVLAADDASTSRLGAAPSADDTSTSRLGGVLAADDTSTSRLGAAPSADDASTSRLGGVLAADDTPDLTALLKARYETDMKTESGRAWWHGSRVSSVSDPSNMVIITTYRDGTTFRDKAKVKAAKQPKKAEVDGRGVPKRLAEARRRRAAEKAQGVTNVVHTITAGEAK